MSNNVMPQNFLWGGAVTSFQTEGELHDDGKGLSIVDVKKRPKEYADWEVAIDFYHKYKEDISLFKELGFKAYRTSISWTRIFPTGEGIVNEEGIRYYERLFKELINNGIEPVVTLYHFDIPLALSEKYNGFASRKVVDLFEYYARTVFKRFKGLVKYWLTFNEHNVILTKPEYWGILDKEITKSELFQACHHSILAHKRAVNALRTIDPKAEIGGMTSHITTYPYSTNPKDVISNETYQEITNYFLVDIYVNGVYPDYIKSYFEENNISIHVTENDKKVIRNAKIDYLSISYYQSKVVRAVEGNDYKVLENKICPHSEWGASIDPIGFRIALKNLYYRFKIPIFITENGLGAIDSLTEDNEIIDDYRINYLRDHIHEMKNAISEGVEVIGYLIWGSTDILSSQGQMEKRYGVIYVNRSEKDIKDLKRIKKKSFGWYQEVISTNAKYI